MHAAKNDVFGVFSVRRPLRQFEGVAADISEFDDLISLVMMAKNHKTAAEFLARRPDAIVELSIVQARYALRQNRLQHERIILPYVDGRFGRHLRSIQWI